LSAHPLPGDDERPAIMRPVSSSYKTTPSA
jgi:hypothetical protein